MPLAVPHSIASPAKNDKPTTAICHPHDASAARIEQRPALG
jgi:hypothetical protein